MLRSAMLALVAAGLALPAWADEVSGTYLETRTCQVYTGPCFANAETALAGKDAVMAWNIEDGKHAGVDLAGLSVVVCMTGSDTLGFGGVNDPKSLKSTVIVDEKASPEQREALILFAKEHAGRAGKEVVRIDNAPITMSLDLATLSGNLAAGKMVKLSTRKARATDCICTNEVAYYPPLAKLQNFAAGVSIEAEYKGRGLGTTWSTPNSRSAYMATFVYE
ncbi:hypothetical protein ETAA8_65780 [Anatilimnocola aggregata]|uniref:DUF1326 domain-containing protein n=1 Tax=Anatilimnocola aggregata TaxID=2528021 RepID=A0A517YMG5_9BACT|nr:DUF1326 domain-containing protein [Anatilimnocola aggregata]QDU31420.1 hypothetical protein ETAA8_65780 [Anatilimnocola aggregata]